MVGIARCNYSECVNRDNCKRYKDDVGEILEFKNICNEENQYKWFWKIDSEIVKENTNEQQ